MSASSTFASSGLTGEAPCSTRSPRISSRAGAVSARIAIRAWLGSTRRAPIRHSRISKVPPICKIRSRILGSRSESTMCPRTSTSSITPGSGPVAVGFPPVVAVHGIGILPVGVASRSPAPILGRIAEGPQTECRSRRTPAHPPRPNDRRVGLAGSDPDSARCGDGRIGHARPTGPGRRSEDPLTPPGSPGTGFGSRPRRPSPRKVARSQRVTAPERLAVIRDLPSGVKTMAKTWLGCSGSVARGFAVGHVPDLDRGRGRAVEAVAPSGAGGGDGLAVGAEGDGEDRVVVLEGGEELAGGRRPRPGPCRRTRPRRPSCRRR